MHNSIDNYPLLSKVLKHEECWIQWGNVNEFLTLLVSECCRRYHTMLEMTCKLSLRQLSGDLSLEGQGQTWCKVTECEPDNQSVANLSAQLQEQHWLHYHGHIALISLCRMSHSLAMLVSLSVIFIPVWYSAISVVSSTSVHIWHNLSVKWTSLLGSYLQGCWSKCRLSGLDVHNQ